MDVARDLWTDITVGERQLAGFIAQCEISGVAASGSARDGYRTEWYKVQRKYLLDKPLGDVIEAGWDPWGPVWQEREWWWKEEVISIDGPGAYREGGSCLLVSGPDWPWSDGRTNKVKIRLVPRGDTTLSAEQLEFGEGYHYISDEMGYDGVYDVEMWWVEPDVLVEDRDGQAILFHFLSYGPGRIDMNELPLDPEEISRGAWNWCCSEEAKRIRELNWGN